MSAGYLFLRFKDGRIIRQINPSQTLMNLQYTHMAYYQINGSDLGNHCYGNMSQICK